ncbi:MAG: hypothetical protein QOH35_5732 [Acidobacteriaceae bacterium]|jgi:hypothetical protein|nr:hypothetical protein [Acidobacteriaceae bacterium]
MCSRKDVARGCRACYALCALNPEVDPPRVQRFERLLEGPGLAMRKAHLLEPLIGCRYQAVKRVLSLDTAMVCQIKFTE